MDTYRYEGPIMKFEQMVSSKWIGYTRANTPGRAKSNLTFQAKRELGLLPTAKISLVGFPEKVS